MTNEHFRVAVTLVVTIATMTFAESASSQVQPPAARRERMVAVPRIAPVIRTVRNENAQDTRHLPGNTLVLEGSAFGPSAGARVVRWELPLKPTTTFPVLSWSNTRIRVRVPSQGQLGFSSTEQQPTRATATFTGTLGIYESRRYLSNRVRVPIVLGPLRAIAGDSTASTQSVPPSEHFIDFETHSDGNALMEGESAESAFDDVRFYRPDSPVLMLESATAGALRRAYAWLLSMHKVPSSHEMTTRSRWVRRTTACRSYCRLLLPASSGSKPRAPAGNATRRSTIDDFRWLQR